MVCSFNKNLKNFSVLARVNGQLYTITEKVKHENIDKLNLQCQNAILQAVQDKSEVIINVKTAEVFPEKGFFLKRESVELERQK